MNSTLSIIVCVGVVVFFGYELYTLIKKIKEKKKEKKNEQKIK